MNINELKDFDILSPQDKAEAMALLKKYEELGKQDSCQKDFMSFVKHMWGDTFIEGRHHKIIADKFNRIAQGKLKRLIVCLPPRHSKHSCITRFRSGVALPGISNLSARSFRHQSFREVLPAKALP